MTDRDDEIFLAFVSFSTADLKGAASRPPLISAIQNFETALVLVAHGRHPAALSACTSAIESAWKAGQGLGPDDRVSLAEVLGEMNNALPVSKALPFSDLTAFRKKRNAVAHFGFSKRDDEESLRLLLSVAIPLLDSWVEHSLGLKLIGALYGDLSERVRLAVKLSPRPKQSPVSISAVDVVRGVQHWIRHHTRLSYLAWWEQELLDEEESSGWRGFELKQALLEKVKNAWDPWVIIDCPICGSPNSLVLRLDDPELESHKLVPIEARCVECGLQLPATARDLIRQLCEPGLTQELLANTLRGYGIK